MQCPESLGNLGLLTLLSFSQGGTFILGGFLLLLSKTELLFQLFCAVIFSGGVFSYLFVLFCLTLLCVAPVSQVDFQALFLFPESCLTVLCRGREPRSPNEAVLLTTLTVRFQCI